MEGERQTIDKMTLFTPTQMRDFYVTNGKEITEHFLQPFCLFIVNGMRNYDLFDKLIPAFVLSKDIEEVMNVGYFFAAADSEACEVHEKKITVVRNLIGTLKTDVWRLLKPELYIELWKFVNDWCLEDEDVDQWVDVATYIIFNIWIYIAGSTEPLRLSEVLSPRFILICQWTSKQWEDPDIGGMFSDDIHVDEGRELEGFFNPLNLDWGMINVTPHRALFKSMVPQQMSQFVNVVYMCSNPDCRVCIQPYLTFNVIDRSKGPLACPRCLTTFFCSAQCWTKCIREHCESIHCNLRCSSCTDLIECVVKVKDKDPETIKLKQRKYRCVCDLVYFCSYKCQRKDVHMHAKVCSKLRGMFAQ